MTHTTTCSGLTGEAPTDKGHVPGGTYDIHRQHEGAMDILDSDDNGNEFPARPGLYFKQFRPRGCEWEGVDGWFGPYPSVEAMPGYVRANLTPNP